jgi:hypothetical protein
MLYLALSENWQTKRWREDGDSEARACEDRV